MSYCCITSHSNEAGEKGLDCDLKIGKHIMWSLKSEVPLGAPEEPQTPDP